MLPFTADYDRGKACVKVDSNMFFFMQSMTDAFTSVRCEDCWEIMNHIYETSIAAERIIRETNWDFECIGPKKAGNICLSAYFLGVRRILLMSPPFLCLQLTLCVLPSMYTRKSKFRRDLRPRVDD